GEIHRVDQAELPCNVLANCQACTRVRLVGDQVRLQPDLRKPRRALQTPRQAASEAAGEEREHLLLRDCESGSPCLLERSACQQQGEYVGLRQGRIRGERGFNPFTATALNQKRDVIAFQLRSRQDIQGRLNVPLTREG